MMRGPRGAWFITGIDSGAEVNLSLEDGRLVITPTVPEPYSLDDLLGGITDENRHEAVDLGPARGGEAW